VNHERDQVVLEGVEVLEVVELLAEQPVLLAEPQERPTRSLSSCRSTGLVR